jgi:integrase
LRGGYWPLIEFARITGLRAKECRTLEWAHVSWGSRQIVTVGKGNKRVSTPITDEVRELLWPLRGHHETFVFTYICRKTRPDLEIVRGNRYPLTKEGLKSAWRRLRAKAKIDGPGGFRFHDWRHDLASKVLRKTGNMKLVQRVLNHSNLTTTAKYAHILDGEISEALLAHAQTRVRKPALACETVSPQNSPQTDAPGTFKGLRNKRKIG